MVHDTHHYSCYSIYHPEIYQRPAEELIPDILKTWSRRNIKPKFHISEQGSGRIGHHSDYIENIPEYLLSIPEKYSVNIDIMVEAKMKEQAILRLKEKYSGNYSI
jgi:UV DNA damage endonuclease